MAIAANVVIELLNVRDFHDAVVYDWEFLKVEK